MQIPKLNETKDFLAEAEKLNPGPWVQHSIYVAKAAKAIAHHHKIIGQSIYSVLPGVVENTFGF